MNTESFDQIYQAYFDPVYRYVLSLSGDAHIAEEITQETFFKALRSLDSYRGDSSLKSWLCTIAKHQLYSALRKNKNQPIQLSEDSPASSAGPEEYLLQREDGLRIHRLLHELPEPQREIFTLRTLGQLSFRDIGELFGKSENWACVVYHRARAHIKDRMED